jgi:hypothetical protein
MPVKNITSTEMRDDQHEIIMAMTKKHTACVSRVTTNYSSPSEVHPISAATVVSLTRQPAKTDTNMHGICI